MKKALSLLLALVLCLSLCACGENDTQESQNTELESSVVEESSTENTNETILTLDNYSQYLNVDACMMDPFDVTKGVNVQAVNNGSGVPYDGGRTFYLYKYFDARLYVEGASSNFNYNDVSVTVRFTGTYQTVDINTSEWDDGNEVNYELSVDCNIAGEGSVSEEFSGNGEYMLYKMSNINVEVISVSGTVTPA